MSDIGLSSLLSSANLTSKLDNNTPNLSAAFNQSLISNSYSKSLQTGNSSYLSSSSSAAVGTHIADFFNSRQQVISSYASVKPESSIPNVNKSGDIGAAVAQLRKANNDATRAQFALAEINTGLYLEQAVLTSGQKLLSGQ